MSDPTQPRAFGGAENSSGVLRAPIDPALLGHATVSPDHPVIAGSYQTFTLVYTAGAYGVDDSGSLRLCFRFASDQGTPQMDRPEGAGYTTVSASNGAVLQARFDPKGNVRPWDKTLYVKVVNGYLLPGDTITIRLGVTDHGGPGLRMQTFCEDSYEFRLLVDPVATFNYQPLPIQPAIRIIPGPPVRYLATLPSGVRAGTAFWLHLKAEDRWGNPTDQWDGPLTLHPAHPILGQKVDPVVGLPAWVTLPRGARFVRLEGLRVDEPGALEIAVHDADGALLCRTNPCRIAPADTALMPFWADLHGQSEETIGTGSAEEYFTFARDLAPVDATGHQGNDFQITTAFWEHLDHLCDRFDDPGRFVVVPGYEWSGNTGLGGDRNVFFPHTGRQIRRSSHALLEDQSDLHTDARTAADLFDAFARNGEFDVVCFAHCGGRYADIAAAHDGRFERSVEVHSSWGTFEWLLHDALDLGYRVGIVANSDGHKGRPGASYPGASMFGAIGGLTCLLMPDLSRAALFDCLRQRRHYATTGGPTGRPLIDLSATFTRPATVYHDDPALGPATGHSATTAAMGDIVHLPVGDMRLSVSITAAAPIERIELFNGRALIHTHHPHATAPDSPRLRILWEGAQYRGRFRQVHWDGTAEVSGNAITRAQGLNVFNPDQHPVLDSPARLRWHALTTGNIGGVDLWLDAPDRGQLAIRTPLVSADLDIAAIDADGTLFDRSAALPRWLHVYRMPQVIDTCSAHLDLPVPLNPTGDNALFVKLTQTDGTIAWTSPVYVWRGA